MANETLGGINRFDTVTVKNLIVTGTYTGTGSEVISEGSLTLTLGNLTLSSGVISQTETTAATALSNTYGTVSNITASATGIVSGNLRGARAVATLSGTVTGGAYVMGGQDKLIVTGTMNHADSRLAAGFSQLDISQGTYTTGQLSGLWVDCGSTASASAVSTKGGGQFNILRLTNTTAALNNSLVYGYADADFLLDLGGPGGNADWFSETGTVTTDDGWLKINLNGTTKYIGLGATVS